MTHLDTSSDSITHGLPIAILRDQLRAVRVSGHTPAASHASARLPDSACVTPVGLGRA
jgi:hypothetical protein